MNKFKFTLNKSALFLYTVMIMSGIFCLILGIKLATWPISFILPIVGLGFLGITALRFYTFYMNEVDVFRYGKLGVGFKLLGPTKALVTKEKLAIIDNATQECIEFIQSKYSTFDPNSCFVKESVLIFANDPIVAAGLPGLNHGVTSGNISSIHYDASHTDEYLNSIVQHEFCHICLFSLGIDGSLHHKIMQDIGFKY